MKHWLNIQNLKITTSLAVCGVAFTISTSANADYVDSSPLRILVPNISDGSVSGDILAFAANSIVNSPDASLISAKGKLELEDSGKIIHANEVNYDNSLDKLNTNGEVAVLDDSGQVSFIDGVEIQGDAKKQVVSQLMSSVENPSVFGSSTPNHNSFFDETDGGVFHMALASIASLIPSDPNPTALAALAPAAGGDVSPPTPSSMPPATPAAPPQASTVPAQQKQDLPAPSAQTNSAPAASTKSGFPIVASVLSKIAETTLEKKPTPAEPQPATNAANAQQPPLQQGNIPTDNAAPAPAQNQQINNLAASQQPSPQAVQQPAIPSQLIQSTKDSNVASQPSANAPAQPVQIQPNLGQPSSTQQAVQAPQKTTTPTADAGPAPDPNSDKPSAQASSASVVKSKKKTAKRDTGNAIKSGDDMVSASRNSVLDKSASALAPKKKKLEKNIDISHSHSIQDISKASEDRNYPSSIQGLSVENKVQKMNIDSELEKAYEALNSGQSDAAIGIYKSILENSPNNTQALFGLATLYHRARQIEKARPLYSKLLTVDPKNRDGFNNFLVLLADDAPDEALSELERLESKNPGFSTIPAQIAIVYEKMGNPEKAIDKMLRAVNLAPENLTYRYNLAVMLDKQKNYDEAQRLYKQLLEASSRGEKIPGNIESIQQRLTFLSSNR